MTENTDREAKECLADLNELPDEDNTTQSESAASEGTEVAKKKRLSKTERKFRRYQQKLANYKQKKLEKKLLKQAESANSPKKLKVEGDDVAHTHPGYLNKRDQKKQIIERLTQVYAPDSDISSNLKICIDCSFSDKMSGKEQSRLAQQIGRCYATNKSLEKPVHFTLCNLSPESKFYAELERVNYGFANYILKRTSDTLEEIYPVDNIVYLSPDATEYLEEVDASKVYVIGGLVDETVSKKVTFNKCEELKIKTYALPIEKYMRRLPGNTNQVSLYSFNKILAINQVFDILSKYYESHSWPDALKIGVPKRKGFYVPSDTEDQPN